ncbi:adenylate/guanylate cyclase domain-containing protein [Leptospira ilyithenensis]|uniref:Adenylate/guanylate cyclase domain-containing protein n=1 Tax=Leptospira ilyithenensis TaxID=2484901 RepID=A0A4R9LW70_9LEPT|nr:adenylate/guanylate cyclase domain-containing protein [Leptospira ilyithenensis]TGN14280.1 adenylate/guanylate cyclase domain-containing protein [Leptospira ilyithenensis]
MYVAAPTILKSIQINLWRKSLFLGCVFLFLQCNIKNQVDIVKNGVADLRSFPFEEGGIASLEGDWEFYPKEILSHDNLQTTSKGYFKIPGLWNNSPVSSSLSDGVGFATYKLEVILPPEEARYVVYVPEQRTAYRLYLTEKVGVRSGIPGSLALSSYPSLQGQSVSIDAKDKLTLVLFVSNFHHREGGTLSPPLLGTGEAIQGYIFANGTIDLALTGAIFMFGIYHFIIFFYRNKQKEAFFFGLFCLVFAIRILFTGNKTIYALTPAIPWDLMIFMEYASVFVLTTLFLWFVEGLFPRFISINLIKTISAIAILHLILFLIVKPLYYTRFEFVFQIFGLVLASLLLFRLIQMYNRRLPESGLFLFGYILLFVGFSIDILSAFLAEAELSVSHLTLFLFFGVQSSIITLRTARIFEKRRQLKEEFEKSNDIFIETNRFYEKFIPREFLTYLGKDSIENISLGDSNQREMTVLFADIWEYYDIIYSNPVETRILFTNSYLGRIGPNISNNNGFIDKYIGSAVMALFDGGIQDAVRAAEQIQWELEKYNERRRGNGFIPLHAGIGIHSGETMLGIIGESERMESTVISDTVNLASRIQGLTKKYSARILISLTSLMLHEDLDNIPYRILDFVRVKGKKETVMIAEVLVEGIDTVSDKKIANKDLFESAIFDYERANFESALEGFKAVALDNPEDVAAEIYVKRAEYNLSAGVGEDWDGVSDWEK